MRVVVKLTGGSTELPADIHAVAEAHGTRLKPTHTVGGGVSKSSWFTAEVADNASAQSLAARLNSTDWVEAAYVEPEAGMP